MAAKSVYGLFFNHPQTGLVIFYVGCTNNIERRTQEHKRNFLDEKHTEYNTYKYRFCRELASEGIDFFLEVVSPQEEVNDEADEYSWILQFARYNEDHNIRFYDGMPLTNMKAGDFLEEVLRDRTVNTAGEIREWTRRREEAKKRTINYVRDNAPNPAPPTFWGELQQYVEQQRAQAEERAARRTERELRRANELAAVRAEQEQAWLRTGKILGDEND